MATLGRTLGPFGNARAAHEAADKAGLKLGMTVEELEVFMTRERKILKGLHKGELETRIVPVVLFPPSTYIKSGAAWRGVAWRSEARRGAA